MVYNQSNILSTDPNFVDIRSTRVLVTSNYDVAKKFTDNLHLKKANDIVNNLTDLERRSILLNPYDDNSLQRFESLEYSLGFTDSSDSVGQGENNFQITLTLIDLYGDLESSFVEGMIDFALAKKTLEGIDKSIGFQAGWRGQRQIRYQESIKLLNESNDYLFNNLNFIKRTFYFVFISPKNNFLSPIVSEFYASEVSQSSTSNFKSNRYVKLKFICTGHVNVLSKLSSLRYYKSSELSTNPYKNVKQTTFEIKKDVDLKFLENNLTELDFFIKSILKELFQQITGREVILVLPDFGKIYKSFRENTISNQKNAALDAISNSFPITYINYIKASNTSLLSFFELLGFNVYDSGGEVELVDQFIEGLSKTERKSFKNFQKTVESYLDELAPIATDISSRRAGSSRPTIGNPTQSMRLLITKLIKDIKSVRGGLSLTDEEQDLGISNTEYARKNFIRSQFGKKGYGLLANPASISVVDQLTKLLDDETFGLITEEQIIQELVSILLNIQNSRLKTIASKQGKTIDFIDGEGIIKTKKTQEQGGQSFKASLNPSQVSINFVISSDETPQSGAFKLPNFIDFNEFANNFSNKLKIVAENSNFNSFNISYTEENTLSRLKILKENVLFNTSPCINNTDSPVIVIFDQWLYENYYCPLNGVVRDTPGDYPISEEDLNNYNNQSKYFTKLLDEKKRNPFVINGFLSPFDENLIVFSDEKSFANWVADDPSPKVNTDFTTNDAVFALQNITPSFSSINKSKNIHPFVLFLYNANINSNLTDTRYNITEFNLVGDTLNSFATYNSYLKFIENSLTQEYLLPARVDAVRRVLGTATLDKIQDKIKEYYNNKIPIDDIKLEISQAIEERFDISPRASITGNMSLVNKAVLSDLISFFGTKNSEYLLDGYPPSKKGGSPSTQDIIQEAENLKKRAIDRVFDILFSFSYRNNKNGYKAVTIEYLSDPINRATELFNLMFSKIYTLKIKSYPMFQINSISNLNFPVSVLIYNRFDLNSMYAQYSRDPKTLKSQLSPISGMYRIIGFKHSLKKEQTGSELKASSEFVLVKNVNVGSAE